MRATTILLLLLGLLPAAAGQSILYQYIGAAPYEGLGTSVGGAGDVNGDGYPDFVVGIPGAGNTAPGSGSVKVLSGIDGSLLFTFDGGSMFDQLGFSVAGAGDVNADGFDDIIAGAPNDGILGYQSGSASVFSGFDGSVLYTFIGNSAGDKLGWSVDGAGDVNGDGYADVIVSAPLDDVFAPGTGSAWVFSGLDGTVLHTFTGGSAGDQLGTSVSGAGDVDNDGFDDVIVGVPFFGSNSGSASVFSGALGVVIYTFGGAAAGDFFGQSVAGAGDVNGDGHADLIVGAPHADPNGSSSGSARVLSGIDGSVLYTFDGDSISDQFGYSVDGADDVNSDGRDDLIVGAPVADFGQGGSGVARVRSGLDGSIIYTYGSIFKHTGDRRGWSVAGVGDVDGDGYADVIVGAKHEVLYGPSSGSAEVLSVVEFTLAAPANANFGGALTYTLSTALPLAGAPYVFDVSLNGGIPGLALPPPLMWGGTVPLNLPFLNLSYGALFPGVFVGFTGLLDASGQATPVFNVPPLPFLTYLSIHGAAIILDPLGPYGLRLISNGVQTILTP